jgi:hypothetical protein
MWRIVGPLLLGTVIAAPAAADESARVWESRGHVASPFSPAGPRTAAADHPQAEVTLPRPGSRRTLARHETPWLAAARHPMASPVLPWLGDGLALPLTERLSLGVDYENIRGEDLWREFAESGSPDYDSHNFLLRAQWRF